MAATAAEARFRIDYPFSPRDSRILAVDDEAAGVVRRASRFGWDGAARFLTFETTTAGGNGSASEATLRNCADGMATSLDDELDGADVAVMVAGSRGDDAVRVIGRACADRNIMTAGVVVAPPGEHTNDAVLALRPFAMVLVVCRSEDELIDLLAALRV